MSLIERLAAKLPAPWDAIVGIPRGGLIVASLLGYALDCPRVAVHGQHYDRNDRTPVLGPIYCHFQAVATERLLVVEDGTDTGTLIEAARRWYLADDALVTTAALWVLKDSPYRPDVWLEEVDTLPSARDLFGGVS